MQQRCKFCYGRYAENFLSCSFLACFLITANEAALDCNMISNRLLRAPLPIFTKEKLNTIPEVLKLLNSNFKRSVGVVFPPEFNSYIRTSFFLLHLPSEFLLLPFILSEESPEGVGFARHLHPTPIG